MLRELVEPHLATLRETAASRDNLQALLEREPAASLPQLIATNPALQTLPASHQILDAATKELYRDADAGLRIIDAILARPSLDTVLRGRALRLRAHALHRQSNGTEARRTVAAAIALLTTEPAGILELLHARLFAAYLRNEMREGDVLLDVRLIANSFADHGDARGALHARIMEAAIVFERNEFGRALRANKEALKLAQGLGDEWQQAILLHNIGQCAQQLALREDDDGVGLRSREFAEEALAYFAQAAPRYAALGMDAESQKIVWAIAGIAQQRGNLEEARAKLMSVRAELLSRSMFLDAALVALDLMELLVMMRREDLVLSWYEEVEATFVSAGMPRYAIEALERVRRVALDRPIDAPLLAEVRAVVRERFAAAA